MAVGGAPLETAYGLVSARIRACASSAFFASSGRVLASGPPVSGYCEPTYDGPKSALLASWDLSTPGKMSFFDFFTISAPATPGVAQRQRRFRSLGGAIKTRFTSRPIHTGELTTPARATPQCGMFLGPRLSAVVTLPSYHAPVLATHPAAQCDTHDKMRGRAPHAPVVKAPPTRGRAGVRETP